MPRAPLVTTYNSFSMPLLAYGEILYDLTFTNSWHVKSIKYNVALAIVAIRTGFMEKPYQELGLESPQQPHWYGKPCFFFRKKMKNQSLKCIFEFIPTVRQVHITRHNSSISLFNAKHGYF